jgi:hypothetical protein
MLWARYLGPDEWQETARAAGFHIAAQVTASYRRGLFDMVFPNRLEITMRLEPA